MTKKIYVHKATGWKGFKNDLRNHLLTGILVLMPFGVTLLVMRWVFGWMAGFLKPWLLKLAAFVVRNPELQTSPPTYISWAASILSIIFLLILVYLVGVLAQRYLGKKLILMGEWLLLKIPVLRTVYGATKQVMTTMALPKKESFLSVVLVEFPRKGMRSIGFLTGFVNDRGREDEFCKVFIPTTPNPTTGFFVIMPSNEVIKTEITVEDAFKTLISFGILTPEKPFVMKNEKAINPENFKD
ncbi:MAG: hypothetical protein BWY69_00481 [Planctomycetes bacterium ADurb.Bin401]|nr:MAG: hypothetical protein BWY69_00481 [Planctomycetes bacterium ADurb.Bin401]